MLAKKVTQWKKQSRRNELRWKIIIAIQVWELWHEKIKFTELMEYIFFFLSLGENNILGRL